MPPHESQLLWTVVLFGLPAHALLAIGFYGRSFPGVLSWSNGRLYAVTLIALAVIRYGVLGGTPLTDDEWAYQFQAATFSQFELWANPPPDSLHFDYLFLKVFNDRWYCYLQPGLALLMTPGRWIAGDGYVSLLPILAGLTPATATLGARICGSESGRVAGLVLLCSPWFLLSCATVEPYGPLAFLLVLWLIWIHRWISTESLSAARREVFILGLLTGATLLLRGLEFGLLGLALIAVFGWRISRTKRWIATGIEGGVFLLGLLPFAIAQLGYDFLLMGDPLQTPIAAHAGPSYYGFGEEIYNQHSPAKGLVIWLQNAGRALIWLSGPLWLITLFGAPRRALVCLGGFVVFWWIAWVPYSMSGVADFGPVYLFALAPILCVLMAGGVRTPRGKAMICAGLWVGITTLGPMMAWQGHRITTAVSAPYLAAQAEGEGTPAIILYRRRFPAPTGWVFGIQPPDPMLNDKIIHGWATPSDLRPGGLDPLRQAFPHRRIMVLDMDYGPQN
jgi:hypothetical protein